MAVVENELVLPPDVALQWARDELGCKDQTLESMRGALLRRMANEQFLPSFEWEIAFRLADSAERFGGRVSASLMTTASPFLRNAEAECSEAVNKFAKEFFELDNGARMRRWSALAKRCKPFPVLTARLEHFEKCLSLDLTAVAQQPDAVRSLAAHVARLFCLPASERAIARHPTGPDAETTVRQWQDIAADFITRFRPIAELDVTLVRELVAAKRDRSPVVRFRYAMRRGVRRVTSIDFVSSNAGAIIATIGLVGAFALIGAPGQQSSTPRPLPSVQQPNNVASFLGSLTPEQIAQSIEAIREKKRCERLPPEERSATPVPRPYVGEAILRLLGVSSEELEPTETPAPAEILFAINPNASSAVAQGTQSPGQVLSTDELLARARQQIATARAAAASAPPAADKFSTVPTEVGPDRADDRGSELLRRKHEEILAHSRALRDEVRQRMEANRLETEKRAAEMLRGASARPDSP